VTVAVKRDAGPVCRSDRFHLGSLALNAAHVLSE
jgi:hypothetical protein